MENSNFYHMFANGDDSRNFIISLKDFYAAFNRIGVCAANSSARVVSFSIEDTHPHVLLYGTEHECVKFKHAYQLSTLRYIAATRGSLYDVVLNYEIYPVKNEDYLKNVAVYTIFQATKDGKKVMPYDYIWGSGSLYFRKENVLPIWYVDDDGNVSKPVPIGTLTFDKREAMLHSRKPVPNDWLTCNGFLLPENYVDVELFESIYQTHNCYRVFLANSKKKDDTVVTKMSKVRGMMIEDIEARKISQAICYSFFRKHDARWLDTNQRLTLAKELRAQYYLSFRQLSTLCRLPELELRKYIR
ncbi:MAG: hypothetical protein J6W18_05705 [Bacteroidaceae bacterium]|nr:hypothetical protein [Bacteroidaceae bacterium]